MSTSNHWLRLWHDMPNDPKWRTIARASGQPISLVQAVYLHLLVDASRNVTRGHATVTPEDLASALDVTEDFVQAILAAMQSRVLDGMRLLGWQKRQPKREDQGDETTGAKSAAQRKKEQREREREARENCRDHPDRPEVSRDVTQGHDREEKRREEKKDSVPDGTGGPAAVDPPTSAPADPPAPPAPEPLTDRELIFSNGVPLLTSAGVAEKHARSMLAGLAKAHGDAAVVDAIQSCADESPVDPVTWMQRRLKSRSNSANTRAHHTTQADRRANTLAGLTGNRQQGAPHAEHRADAIDVSARVVAPDPAGA